MAEENGNEKELDGYLPGMKPKKIAAIIEAANAYEAAHKARMKLSAKEKQAGAALVDEMQTHGLTRYEYGDCIVDITETLKPVVRRTARDNGEESKPKKKVKAKA